MKQSTIRKSFSTHYTVIFAILCASTLCLILTGCGGKQKTQGVGVSEVKVKQIHYCDGFTTSDNEEILLYGVKGLGGDLSDEYRLKATDFFREKASGKTVKVDIRVEKIVNGTPSLYALVYLQDGTLINELMLSEGYVCVNELALMDDPDLLNRFLALQKKAQNERKGSWAFYADKLPKPE